MDDSRHADEAAHPPFQGPHRRRDRDADAPDAILPLRLVLQPAGPSVELTRSGTVLGRHSSADVRLPLPDVSRRHCRFDFAGGRWLVTDLDSLNGLFVNGELVQQAELRHRDRLRVGGFVLEVDLRAGERTVQLPAREAGGSAVLRRIADALPPTDAGPPPPLRRAS
jgi:pSer/pThr/pTyr-binding forkhead associated (FHA) protein